MRILHFSNTPLSNAPANLAKIQKDSGHDVRCILDRQVNANRVFVGGEIWRDFVEDQLAEIIESAEVIHYHNYAFEQFIFNRYPKLIDLARKKPSLIQYHSPRRPKEGQFTYDCIPKENFEPTFSDPFFRGRRAVVAQYQVRQYNEAEFIVPNTLPIFDPLYTAVDRDWTSPAISFAPSNIHLKGWDYKGYDKVKPVFDRIASMPRVTCGIIMNTSYAETMFKKKWSTIGMEELVTGSYHLSFLEYMSFGCATLHNMDEATKIAMAHVVGTDAVNELPALQTTVAGLFKTLHDLVTQPEEAKATGLACRKWMELHWNPNTFVKYFDNIYSKL